MGIWDDIKKGLKGSDEYRAGKAKKKASKKAKTIAKASKKRDKAKKSGKVGKQKRAQNKINKASGSKVKHTKASIKKANEADKSWSKATKAAKKSAGPSISTLVKARGMHKKGSNEYNQIQNKINEHYGSKVKHKVSKAPKKSSGVGRLDRDKVAGKVKDKRPIVVTVKKDARPKKEKKPTVHKTHTPSEEKSYVKPKAKKQSSVAGPDYKKNPELIAGPEKKEGGGMIDRPQYGSGGKVEGGGLFNFPTRDSRKK